MTPFSRTASASKSLVERCIHLVNGRPDLTIRKQLFQPGATARSRHAAEMDWSLKQSMRQKVLPCNTTLASNLQCYYKVVMGATNAQNDSSQKWLQKCVGVVRKNPSTRRSGLGWLLARFKLGGCYRYRNECGRGGHLFQRPLIAQNLRVGKLGRRRWRSSFRSPALKGGFSPQTSSLHGMRRCCARCSHPSSSI